MNRPVAMPVTDAHWVNRDRFDSCTSIPPPPTYPRLPDVRVPLQALPTAMPAYADHSGDAPAQFKKPRYALMPQVVEMQIVNPQHLARPRECRPYRVGAVRENGSAGAWLALDDSHGFWWHIHPLVVPLFIAGVLHVPHQHAPAFGVQVCPLDARDFLLSPRAE